MPLPLEMRGFHPVFFSKKSSNIKDEWMLLIDILYSVSYSSYQRVNIKDLSKEAKLS